MVWTITVTVLRAVRLPNDFAEAHWLLDYRFGFVKRGLVGTIVSLLTKCADVSVTEGMISILSVTVFLIYCAVIIFLSLRIVNRARWSTGAILVTLVFLSSPFIVMSAHLVGYYDNIIILLGILSIALLIKGNIWLATSLQGVAILTHEISLLLTFPVLCLAWWLMNAKRQQQSVPPLPLLPLLLPVLVFVVQADAQIFLDSREFVKSFSAYLSRFEFIQEGRSLLVPFWIATPFYDWFVDQRGALFARLLDTQMLGLVLPSVCAILYFIARVYRTWDRPADSLILLGVCFAPQIIHLVAWDTSRIWPYTILCSFLAFWIYAELVVPHQTDSLNIILCLAALAVNAVALTPLMDRRVDHFSLGTRLCLYAPVFAGALALIFVRKPPHPE